MNPLKKIDNALALILILIAVAYRAMPHPQNVAPVAAVAIFAAAALPARLAFTVPVIAMIVSDLMIGPHGLFWLTWSAFALTGLLGLWLRERVSPVRILAASVAGSTFYFLVTNLGVFLFENLYPKTGAGLAECFTMALPFYRNTLIGDLLFSGILFSAYALFARRAAAAPTR